MRCLITGAAGYVGSAIAANFADAGWEVIGAGRRRSLHAASHLPYDLASDPRRLPWAGVDALIHTAYDFLARGAENIRETNIDGSRRMLRAAQDGGVRQIVFISSMSAFPGCRSLYGKAKLEIEQATLELGGTVVRPGLVFGGETGGMIRALGRAVTSFPVVPLIGDGSYPQYLVHCDDLARLVVARCRDDAASIPRPISAAHPCGIPFRALLQTLARQRQAHPRFVAVPWRGIHFALRAAEALHLPVPFRSDSLIGIIFQNPAPDFSLPEMPEISFRPFA